MVCMVYGSWIDPSFVEFDKRKNMNGAKKTDAQRKCKCIKFER